MPAKILKTVTKPTSDASVKEFTSWTNYYSLKNNIANNAKCLDGSIKARKGK